MAPQVNFNSLLVPVDFSPSSRAAFQHAIALADGTDAVIIALHALDPMLIEFAETHDFGSHEEVVARMRQRAKRELELYKSEEKSGPEIETVICEGVPFLEILKKADDFAVDMIVMGKVGRRGQLEKLLFGSTAEKVLRAAKQPVVVLPFD